MGAERLISNAGSQRSRGLLSALVLAAVTLLAYLPVLRGGFFWDDYNYLVNNPLMEAPDGLRRFWLTTEATEYLPLTYTMHWVEWRLWGGHPAGYHIVNVLLHAAGAALLWRVLRRLGVPGAWLAGLLFAVHPVAAASAGWIMELKNVLSMVFYLSSLLAFLKFDERAECRRLGDSEIGKLGKRKGERIPEAADDRRPNLRISQFPIYLLSVILFLLALLSKTSVVMLPVVLLLCAWWRGGKISRKDLLRSVPFFALSLALGLVTVWFQKDNAIHGEIVRPEGLASRLAASGWIAWFYLFKLLLPVGLCAVYPRWNVDGSSLLAFLPLVLLAAGMTLLWARRRSWGRAPLFAAGYFLIALLPVLGFADMGIMKYTLAADHLQYAAMIGVIAFAAGILARACPERSRGPAAQPALRGRTAAVAAAGCAIVLAGLTWGRASLYGDDRSLWRDNVNKNSAAWLAWNNLGWTYSRAGLDEKAIPLFSKSVEFNPEYARAYNNRALALARLGRCAEALEDFNKAIALKLTPDLALAYNNRAVALVRLGRYAEALDDFNRTIALKVKPDLAFVYSNRAGALAHLGRYAEALDDCNKAIALKPGDAGSYNDRAVALTDLGRYAEALDDCNKAIALKPDDAGSYNNRAVALTGLGRYAEAVADFNMAVKLMPSYAEAFLNRASAHIRMGQRQLALDDCNQAISLKPDLGAAYDDRGNVYFQMGRHDRAISDYDRAIHYAPNFARYWHDRGKARAAAGRLADAIQDYDEALRRDANCADAYNSRGNARTGMDPPDYDGAINDYGNAIRRDPSNAKAFYNRGTALALSNRHVEAVQDYSRAIALNPDFSDSYYNRAISYCDLKEYSKAWSDLKMSEKLGVQPDAAFLRALTQALRRTE